MGLTGPARLYISQTDVAAQHVCFNSQACSLLVSLSTRLEDHIERPVCTEVIFSAAALSAARRCVTEVKEYVISASSRGWFRRILNQALCSADVTHILVHLVQAAEGVGLQLDCPKTLTGDEDAIKAVIDSIEGGLDAAVSDSSIDTQVQLSNLITEEAMVMLPDILLEEQLVVEASKHPGGHWALRNCDLRTFWFAAFGHVEDVSWSHFWSQFPAKVPDRVTKNILADLFSSHSQKTAFQDSLLTIDSCYISCAELDLHFPPEVDMISSCCALLAIRHNETGLLDASKFHSQPCDSSHVRESASIAARQVHMNILTSMLESIEPVRVVQLIGPEGSGKRNAVEEAVNVLCTRGCWSPVIVVDLKCVRSVSHFQGVLLTAFGLPPMMHCFKGLLAHLKRYHNSAKHRMCLVLHNIGHLLETELVEDQFEQILEEMLQHADALRLITTSRRPFGIGGQKTFICYMNAPTIEQAIKVLGCPDEQIVEAVLKFGTLPLMVQLLAALLRGEYQSLGKLLSGPATHHRLLRLILAGLPAKFQYALCCLTTFPAQFEMDGAEAVLADTLTPFQVKQFVKETLQLDVLRQDKQRTCWLIEPVRAALLLFCEDQGLNLEQARSMYSDFVLCKLAAAEALQQVSKVTSARLLCQTHVDIIEAVQQAPRQLNQPLAGGWYKFAGLMDLISDFDSNDIWMRFCKDCFAMALPYCNQETYQRAAWQLALLQYKRGRWDLARLYILQGGCGQQLHAEEIVVYCRSAARNCMKMGLFQDARSLLERAFGLLSTDASWDHLSVLAHHAIVLQQLGFVGEAEDAMQLVQKSHVKCGRQQQELIAALAVVATAYSRTHKYSEAELLLRRCLQLQQDHLGSKHVKALVFRRDLATLLLRGGQKGEAKILLQFLLAEFLDRFGPDCAEVADIRHQLAEC